MSTACWGEEDEEEEEQSRRREAMVALRGPGVVMAAEEKLAEGRSGALCWVAAWSCREE